jgi:hypothetical protein
MNRFVIAVAVSMLSTAALAAEPVATLSAQQGTVLVNQGEEFVTAVESQALQPGDRVMVMEGGSAQISFTDGCQLALESGSLVVVPAQSTCAGGVASVRKVAPSYAQAVGSTSRERPTLTQYVVIGGVIIAIMTIDDDDEPFSP